MPLHAQPQLNGNSREDFEAAYMLLREAHSAVERAYRVFMCDIANGRNYQHLGDAGSATCIDDRLGCGKRLHQAQALIGSVASDLVDALEEN
jgi:hypothetical protein